MVLVVTSSARSPAWAAGNLAANVVVLCLGDACEPVGRGLRVSMAPPGTTDGRITMLGTGVLLGPMDYLVAGFPPGPGEILSTGLRHGRERQNGCPYWAS